MDNDKKRREIQFTQYLDPPTNLSELRVRVRLSEDHKGVESFSVSQRSAVWGKIQEIIRFDCSAREGVNVHKFFKKPAEKLYLDKEKTYDTIFELMDDIEKKWQIYKSRYEEKR